MIRNVAFFLAVSLLLPFATQGQVFDTAMELKSLVGYFKGLKNISYDYEMRVAFPNGENDRMNGMISLNNEEMVYYNDCDAFVMIYTSHLYYKADHRKKQLTIINIDKEYNKTLKKATEKDIFQNGAVNSFLDSVLLKTALVKKIKREKDTLEIALEFPQTSFIKVINIRFNERTHLPVTYNMTVTRPWQKTPKGMQVIETTIKCKRFKKNENERAFIEGDFFSYKKNKIELKKYTEYKLLEKM